MKLTGLTILGIIALIITISASAQAIERINNLQATIESGQLQPANETQANFILTVNPQQTINGHCLQGSSPDLQ